MAEFDSFIPVIVDPNDVIEIVNQYLTKIGLLDKIDHVKQLIDKYDEILFRIQADGHYWTKTDTCPSCNKVTEMLGRPFGCCKKHKEG